MSACRWTASTWRSITGITWSRISRASGADTVVSVNTSAEPLGTLEVALRHAARLLEREPAAAAEQAAEILKVHPDQPDALALSGLALGRLGKGEEAIAALRRAVHFKPELR